MPRIGELSLSGNVRIDGDLNFVGAQKITTTSGNLTLLPKTGSGITVIGDAGTPPAGFTANDDLYVSGKLQVDGTTYFQAEAGFYSSAVVRDDIQLKFGSGNDTSFLWETADPNANELLIALPDGGATNVPVIVIGDQGIINSNLGWFNGQTIPRVAMVAADEGGYFAFGVDNSDILDILATTAPVVETDETKFSHKLQCVINGSTYYIMLTAS